MQPCSEGSFFRLGTRFFLGNGGIGQEEVVRSTDVRRFRQYFGCSAFICSELWILLSRLRLVVEIPRPEHLLWALFFLKQYAIETVASPVCHTSDATYRNWVWRIVELLSRLKVVRQYCCSCCYCYCSTVLLKVVVVVVYSIYYYRSTGIAGTLTMYLECVK